MMRIFHLACSLILSLSACAPAQEAAPSKTASSPLKTDQSTPSPISENAPQKPLSAPLAMGDVYRVYFLGGQSNMEGYGFAAELDKALKAPRPDIRLFTGYPAADDDPAGGAGLWAALEPGHGTGFFSDGQTNTLSDRFGPELSFGARIAELNPNEKIAIVKYARGGSSLALDIYILGAWAPDYKGAAGLNQYDHALKTLRAAFAPQDIDGDGNIDRFAPAGIIWMQGETDANNLDAARAYQSNLANMMNLLRAALRVDDLPVVIGRITDSGMSEDGKMMDHIEIVQKAQADFVASDPCAAYIREVDDYRHIDDGWHYDSAAYISMGRAFANAAHQLSQDCGS